MKPWEVEEGREMQDLSGKITKHGFIGVLEANGKK